MNQAGPIDELFSVFAFFERFRFPSGVLSSCCLPIFLVFCECVLVVCLPYEFDCMGFSPWIDSGGKRTGADGGQTREPKKCEKRHLEAQKALQMQKDDAPEQQRVGANCRRSKLNDLKAKKSTAVPGHHCLMLAVSTLR